MDDSKQTTLAPTAAEAGPAAVAVADAEVHAAVAYRPVLAAVQHLVPPGQRATASALFLFVNNLLGLGVGTMLIGAISDALNVRGGAGVESLRYAILAGLSCYLVAAGLFARGARFLERDWVAESIRTEEGPPSSQLTSTSWDE